MQVMPILLVRSVEIVSQENNEPPKMQGIATLAKWCKLPFLSSETKVDVEGEYMHPDKLYWNRGEKPVLVAVFEEIALDSSAFVKNFDRYLGDGYDGWKSVDEQYPDTAQPEYHRKPKNRKR